MKKLFFTKGRWIQSALSEAAFPPACSSLGRPVPEIAFVGRSNVGKSSLINHLLNDKKLAKTSATPGKTQTLNFFLVDDSLLLVDLPGYGYAKVPMDVKKKWGQAIDHYLLNRPSLNLILLLLDSRHLPSQEDLAFAKWVAFQNKPLLVIFTKCDKLNAREKNSNIKAALELLATATNEKEIVFVDYSIKDPLAKEKLIATINRLLLQASG